jgi:hypothetical protein
MSVITPEAEICQRYLSWADARHSIFNILFNPVNKKVCISNAFDDSSHGPRGTARKRKKIMGSLRHHTYSKAVVLTVTFQEYRPEGGPFEGLTREESWLYITRLVGDYIDQVNKWRKNHGAPPFRKYLWALEEQEERHFPHVHILFFDTSWILKAAILRNLWPWGNIDLTRVGGGTAAHYITKYLTKMEGRDFFHSMTWGRRLRTYALSHALSYLKKVKPKSTWVYLSSPALSGAIDSREDFLRRGYLIPDQSCLQPRAP